MVDIDGSYTYSYTVKVARAFENENWLVYPNSARNSFQVRNADGHYHIRLIAADARVAKQWQNQQVATSGTILDLHGLPKGAYRLLMQDASGKAALQSKNLLIQ